MTNNTNTNYWNYANEIYGCKDGAWFDFLYTYTDEHGEAYECETEIYAESREDAISKFFNGDEKQEIPKKSDDFRSRVSEIVTKVR